MAASSNRHPALENDGQMVEGGGRESSFVYHWAKRSALPLWVFAWVAYLAAPVTVHPSVVVIPLAVPFAASVAV